MRLRSIPYHELGRDAEVPYGFETTPKLIVVEQVRRYAEEINGKYMIRPILNFVQRSWIVDPIHDKNPASFAL